MLLHPSSIDFSRDQLELKQIENSESTAQFWVYCVFDVMNSIRKKF